MLRAYFDDSGTHADSRVVVIGGLIGTDPQWARFKEEWAALLKQPLPGKTSLRMFHLSTCNARAGEFIGYSDAEQDAVIHDFRKIIINAELISIAAAVDRKAWCDLVIGAYRESFGDALSHCIAYCIEETIRIANPHAAGDEISIVIDKEILSQEVRKKTEPYTYALGHSRIRAHARASGPSKCCVQNRNTGVGSSSV
jgi:hypothetical protein